MRTISIIALLVCLGIVSMAQPNNVDYRQLYEKSVFTDSLGTRLPYRLLTPERTPKDIGSATKKYPVILFLHGAGERGHNNESNLMYIDKVFASPKLRAEHPCYVIIPQCEENFRWCETDWTLPYHSMPLRISAYLGAANELLDSVLALPDADRNRVYVTGMSMGGFGTWDIACRFPNKFAAIMPICGGADEKVACRIKHLPIRTFHGSADRLVKVERSRNITNAIKACGGKNIEYTEWQGMGHLIWDKVYSNYQNLEWLFSNKRN